MRALTKLPVELDRVLAAIRAGMDANLAAATTKQIQLDIATAEITVIAWKQQHRPVRSLSAMDVAAALDHAGDLARILKDAEREARARLYRTLGLQLLLDRSEQQLEPVRVDGVGVDTERVAAAAIPAGSGGALPL